MALRVEVSAGRIPEFSFSSVQNEFYCSSGNAAGADGSQIFYFWKQFEIDDYCFSISSAFWDRLRKLTGCLKCGDGIRSLLVYNLASIRALMASSDRTVDLGGPIHGRKWNFKLSGQSDFFRNRLGVRFI